jgi:hypothetical protein
MTQPPQIPPAQGPPPSGPPYQPYPPYPPYPPPVNTYAILSLVLAVAVFPPLGIYFGNKAKEQIARTGERGVELATVGIVLGWIFTAIFGALILIWCGMALVMFGGLAASGTA